MSRFLLLVLVLIFLLLSIQPGVAQEREITPSRTETTTPTITLTPEPARVVIRAPQNGQALQGIVAITGNSAVANFQSAEIAFAYHDNPTQTWFQIYSSSEAIAENTLAQWDTTTITDGVYDLRLVVTLQDGSQDVFNVSSMRVRNYTPIETATPTPVTPTATPEPGDTPIPSATPTATQTSIPPTPTKLPANPAEISRQDLALTFVKGALAVLGLFALMGIYAGIKQIRRRG
jgi:hypothetical protein